MAPATPLQHAALGTTGEWRRLSRLARRRLAPSKQRGAVLALVSASRQSVRSGRDELQRTRAARAVAQLSSRQRSSPPSSQDSQDDGDEQPSSSGFHAQSSRGWFSSEFDSAILALAAPTILALAADPLLAIVDTAIVGQLGQQDLAALGVNNSLFSLCFVVFNFLSVATTPTVAAALSANDKKRAGETIAQALVLALVLGSVVAGGLLLSPHAALLAMGIDPGDSQLMELAAAFLLIRATAAPAVLLVTVSQGVFRGLQDMRTPLAVTLGTNLLHLALSLLFIFKMNLGLPGAALSTTVAEWAAAGAYLGLGWQRRQELGLASLPSASQLWNMTELAPFLQAGGAVLMRTAVLLGAKTMASMVATRLGSASIASHQVVSQVWVLSSLLIDSLAIAGQTLVAVRLGQGDRASARQVTNRLLQLGSGLGLGLAAVLGATSPWWPQLFTHDAEVLSSVQTLLPMVITMVPVNALVYVLDGVLVGASDFQFLVSAMVLAAGSSAAMLLAVEPMHLGVAGVWGAMSALMLGRCSTLIWRFMSEQGPLPPSALRPLQQQQQLAAAAAGAASTASSSSSSSLDREAHAAVTATTAAQPCVSDSSSSNLTQQPQHHHNHHHTQHHHNQQQRQQMEAAVAAAVLADEAGALELGSCATTAAAAAAAIALSSLGSADSTDASSGSSSSGSRDGRQPVGAGGAPGQHPDVL